MANFRVERSPRGRWYVLDRDDMVVRACSTQAEAWRWIDRHDPEAIEDENRRRRISTAFSENT